MGRTIKITITFKSIMKEMKVSKSNEVAIFKLKKVVNRKLH